MGGHRHATERWPPGLVGKHRFYLLDAAGAGEWKKILESLATALPTYSFPQLQSQGLRAASRR